MSAGTSSLSKIYCPSVFRHSPAPIAAGFHALSRGGGHPTPATPSPWRCESPLQRPQETPPRAGLRAQTRPVGGFHLAGDQSEAPLGQALGQIDQRHFRSIRRAGEHAFAKKNRAERDAV